jgi:Phosphotransferase enzyme family
MFLEKAKVASGLTHSVALDGALPALSLFERPAELIGILSALLAERLGANRWVADCCATVRRYVPGKRCIVLFEVRIESEESSMVESQSLIGKLYADSRGQKVFETLQELWSRGFADGKLTISEPLAYDPRWQLLLLGHCKGKLLRNLILAQADIDRALEGAAEWLAKLHACGIPRGRRYSLDGHLKTFGARTRELEQVSPDIARHYEEILIGIERHAHDIEERSAGPTHRDFSPDHLIVDGNRFIGLDFDEFCQYDPLFDVAHFIAHIGYLGLLHSGSLHQFDSLTARFCTAYKSCTPNRSVARLGLNLALAYLKLAQIVGLVTRPDNREEMMHVLLAEAQQFSEAR